MRILDLPCNLVLYTTKGFNKLIIIIIIIIIKTLTANWPTDANETWWQNGDNDDNVDDVDDKEEKEEENDDDDDDADVDSGIGARSDDDDDDDDDDVMLICSWWPWRWSWLVSHDCTYSQTIFYCSSKILYLKTCLPRPMFSFYNVVTSISSSSSCHPLNCVTCWSCYVFRQKFGFFFFAKRG